MAVDLVEGRGFHLTGRPAPRPPLYPLILAGEYLVAGRSDLLPVLVQAAMGTTTVLLVYLIGRRLFSEPAGLAAAALAAVYPYYVAHDPAQQDTALFTLLTAAGAHALIRLPPAFAWRDAAWAGLVLGLGILGREPAAPFAALGIGWLAVLAPTPSRRSAWRAAGVATLTAALVVSPWLARNARIYGRLVYTTGESCGLGQRLWVGIHPLTFTLYPRQSIDLALASVPGTLDPAQQARLAAMGELERDRWFLDQALARITAAPAAALGAVLVKLGAGLGPLISPRGAGQLRHLLHAASYIPVLVLGLVGAWRSRGRWRELGPVYAVGLTFVLVTALTWAHTSHRSHLDVYLMTLAAPVLLTAGRRFGWGQAPVAGGPDRRGRPAGRVEHRG
jgi:4-amino-4-deoxy-L-arabinose transferase-like glycosyltransferase